MNTFENQLKQKLCRHMENRQPRGKQTNNKQIAVLGPKSRRTKRQPYKANVKKPYTTVGKQITPRKTGAYRTYRFSSVEQEKHRKTRGKAEETHDRHMTN